MELKELAVTVLAVIGAVSILNYVIVHIPGLLNGLFWLTMIVAGTLAYNHYSSRNKGDK